ncbi:CpsD/CapB family tyrosine-protein kinase [Seohaeicola zhoushanensis]|uniref:Chromosome partitioning ATPase, Mrp family, contains Fe-S cluster n=1 Tax=Seohaeicola zhoushanensis TaxID=1569283 RepID=A0A8J3GZ46_9RHOB|nr:CpsD/CapB family tyrosine-protein kinase [Seohaeicola zhoushanensis]GHF54901.1 hypothetical protein GCM10017056_28040 [Seohaeicola zhoushanensis]
MDDEHPFDRTDHRLGTLWHSLPEPKNRGFFRKTDTPAPVSQPVFAPRPAPGPAKLRVVTSTFTPAPAPRAPVQPSGDIWSGLRAVRPVLPMNGAGDETVELAFDQLRTRLLKHLRGHGLRRIALAAPTAGCGTTFATVNLARSFAMVPGLRTVVMDLNLHRPALARALRVMGPDDMRGFLTGRERVHEHFVRLSDTLAAGLARDSAEPAAGLLNSDAAALAVTHMMDQLQPDVLICDLPPILERDDLSAFLPQVDGVVLVADATRTRPEHITRCEEMLAGQSPVLGVVLNLARRTGPDPAHV